MVKVILVAITLTVLLFSLIIGIEGVNAQTLTITIQPDGSLNPSSSAIQREGNVYIATADLNFAIDIQKSDITVDGANHTIQGPGSSKNFIAITLKANNITVTNFHIAGWKAGVYGAFNKNTITNNVFIDNYQSITLYASDYMVSKNNISLSDTAILIDSGALQPQGDNNLIFQNQLVSNNWAFDILYSNGTTVTKNNVTDNAVVLTLGALKDSHTVAGHHLFYLNNFVDNKQVLNVPFGEPFVSGVTPISPAGNWDNGTIGNYWSDYITRYPNASETDHLGIGDTPYLIQETTSWSSDYSNGTHSEGTTVFGVSNDHYPLLNAYNGPNGATSQSFSQGSNTPLVSSSSSSSPNSSMSTSAEYVALTILAMVILVIGSIVIAYKRKHHA